jgi:hypothetical protein
MPAGEQAMVAMLVQIRRKSGMGDADFYAHWRGSHATIVTRNAAVTGVTRYVQSHRVPCTLIDTLAIEQAWQGPPNGLATLSWPDLQTMLAASSTPEAAAVGPELRADEQRFADPHALCGMIACAEERFGTPDVTGPAPVKLVTALWRLPGTTLEDFSARWRGAFAASLLRLRETLGFERYVQNHRSPNFPVDLATARGWQPSPDGIGELCWPDRQALEDWLSRPAGRAALMELRAAMADFADPARGNTHLSIEYEIFDRALA